MYRRLILWTLAFVLIAGTYDASAQGRGRGKGNESSNSNSQSSPAKGSGFDADEARIIREWFSNSSNLKGLPPGLAKREKLPPGLQRQLVKNGKLPPGLEKKIQPLPRDLEMRLPRLPDGRKRIVIAGNVILLEERTAAIVDILQNIF